MLSNKTTMLPLVLGGLLFSNLALAEDRALIIGVGKYMDSNSNLKGIDIDADAARQMAQMMGFKTNQIKTLMDEQATAKNAVNTIQSWLIKGTSSNDRAFLYFSGHGTRVRDTSGDETEDQLDEALVMHDARIVTVDNRKALAGVLVDDDLNMLINNIPSQNVLVLIDACHSGSATRSLTLDPRFSGLNVQGDVKYYNWSGDVTQQSSASIGLRPESLLSKSGIGNSISIAAAGDNEQSIATPKGSVFTLGLLATVKHAFQQKQPLTPASLHKEAYSFVETAMADSGREFYPVLSPKNSPLASRSLRVEQTASAVSSGAQRGPIWSKLVNTVKTLKPIGMRLNKKNYRNGDLLNISLAIPASGGYLNVINIDPEDNATVLYPNKLNPENYLKGGELVIPTPQMKFNLVAQAPYGETVNIALFTKNKLNFYQSGKGERNDFGDLNDTLAELSAESYRSFSIEEKKKSPAMGAYIVTRVDP